MDSTVIRQLDTLVNELLYKLVLFCDIVSVGKKSYCEFDKFEVGAEKGTDDK